MSQPLSDRQQETIAFSWLTGVLVGGGLAGIGWMNPYIALSLVLGGMILLSVIVLVRR